MPLLYGHYCIATREGNYSGLLLIVSGVKDGDGASFMSLRVFLPLKLWLVTHIFECSNRRPTHSQSIFTCDNFPPDEHSAHVHTNMCTLGLKASSSMEQCDQPAATLTHPQQQHR